MRQEKNISFVHILFRAGCSVILMLCVLALPNQVQAETLTFEGELNGTTSIDLTDRSLTPGKTLPLRGRGEAGQEIQIELFSETGLIETVRVTVEQDGTWQASMPIMAGTPATQLRISSTFSPTSTERVTSVLALGTLVTVGVVLFELLVERLLRLLQTLGLLGKSQTKGYVFNVETKEPVAFALLTIESVAMRSARTDLPSQRNEQPRLFETVVSTVDGFFRSVDLPAGKYRIQVAHPSYTFPPTGAKPWYAKPFDFYQGGVFELKHAKQLDVISIPMQPREKSNTPVRYWLNVRVFTKVMQHILHVIRGPMMIASFVFLLLSPSLINFLFVSLYLFTFLFDLFGKLSNHQIQGTVLDEHGNPVQHAVVRIVQSPPEELSGVLLTPKNGRFAKRLSPGQYRVAVSKDGYITDQADGLSFEMLDLKESHRNLLYQLKKIAETAHAKQA